MAGDTFQEMSLDEIADFRNGKAISAEKYTELGEYPVFGANGQIARSDDVLNPEPVVVIGRVGAYCGSVHYISGPSWVTDNAIVATTKLGNDVRFLYYLLVQLKLRRTAIGSAQPLMTQGGLKIVRTVVPPLKEQQAIACILGALDDKIELNRRMNETLEAIAQAIFKSWFVDFDPVRAKAAGQQPPGLAPQFAELFPESFEESELGEIPQGWRILPAGDVIERVPVGQKYEQKTVKAKGLVPVLDQGKSGIIGYHDESPGVVASTGKPIAVFANHTCYMRLVYFPFSAIQNVLPFVGRQVDTMWVFFATNGIQPFIEYKGHWPDFIIHKLVVPNAELTSYFSNQVRPFLKRMWENEMQSQTLSLVRDALLPRLISGELRVPDAERIVGRCA